MQLDGFDLSKRVTDWSDGTCRIEYRIRSTSHSAWLLVHRPGETVPDVTFVPEDSFKRAILYVPREQVEQVDASLIQ